jgi:uncharacterized membrane protein YidH (DUF202 family)
MHEEQKRRLAKILAAAGALLVILGSIAVVLHYQQFSAPEPPAGKKSPEEIRRIAKAIELLLVIVMILFITFAFAALAFLRWSRRFRQLILRKPRPRTQADNLWDQHRLPDDVQAELDSQKQNEQDGPQDDT